MAVNLLVIFAIPIFLLLMVGAVVLQVFWARDKRWWLGIILPVASLLVLVLSIVFAAYFVAINFFLPIIFIFSNILMVVLTVMYFALHKRADKINEIKKMNIQDLE